MKNTHQRRAGNSRTTSFYAQNTQDEIVITQHVLDRLAQRNQKQGTDRASLERTAIQQIRQSKILSMKGNEEHRSHYGNIYVCKREKGILRDRLVAVTLKLSDVRQRQHFSDNFASGDINFAAMGTGTLDKTRHHQKFTN